MIKASEHHIPVSDCTPEIEEHFDDCIRRARKYPVIVETSRANWPANQVNSVLARYTSIDGGWRNVAGPHELMIAALVPSMETTAKAKAMTPDGPAASCGGTPGRAHMADRSGHCAFCARKV